MCSEDNGIGVAVYQILVCVTLWHMSIGAGIVISISFQKIDDAPRAQTGAQRDNQNLQGINSRSEKTHIRVITSLSNEK